MQGGLLVIDASIAIKWLNEVNELYVEQAYDILTEATANRFFLFTPDILIHEVCNVLVM